MSRGADSRILHLWGAAAAGPEADAAAIAEFAAAHSGAGPSVVVTPTYWGGRRRELLADELLRQGFDPRITDIATELMGMEEPTAAASFLVEVEPGRVCVSLLDFASGLAESRITHRGGDATVILGEVVADLLRGEVDGDGTAYPTADVTADVSVGATVGVTAGVSVEYIVADDRRLVADLRRRDRLAFPAPVGLIGAGAAPGEVTVSDEIRPVSVLSEDPDRSMVPEWAPPDGLDIAALRRRARDAAAKPRESSHRRIAAVAGVAAVVVAVLALTVIVDGPVGRIWRDQANRPDASAPRGDDVAAAGVTDDGARVPEPQPTGPSDPTGRSDPTGPGGSAVLEGHGVRAVMPDGWRVDDSAGLTALVMVDGGPMRVLVTAGEVEAGMGHDALEAGLSAHAAGDPAMDRVRAEVIEGLDVVVHEERPGDGSVVLWQHRIVGTWQVSVGCQFRGATIPQVRPVCGRALRTAEVIGP